MKPLFINQTKARLAPRWMTRWFASLARRLHRQGHAGLAQKELVVVFVESAEMKRLNKQYRGKNYATDILSFASADEDALGELVLCLDTIRAQSHDTGLSARGELGYMLVHGVLHLLGYDHEIKADEAKMFALQDELYLKLEKSVGLR